MNPKKKKNQNSKKDTQKNHELKYIGQIGCCPEVGYVGLGK